ncbi:MAG: hypothetical protein JWN75_99 [Candidatus Saccharibacteria bacterium]|nr:hypothetical protein [Candidatus Saccharibacteria bacterium]
MKSLQLDKPHILVVVGLPGAGKTFFAKQFSGTFNAPYIDYNHYRQLLNNDQLGDQVTGELLDQLFLTRQTIIMDNRGNQRLDRRELTLFAHKKGYEVLYVWVQTEPLTAEQRAVTSKTATMTRREFDERTRQFEILTKGELYLVISGKHTYASQARVVLKKLVGTTRNETHTPVIPTRQAVPPRSGRITIG